MDPTAKAECLLPFCAHMNETIPFLDLDRSGAKELRDDPARLSAHLLHTL
jgi:hypothetical protein